MQRERPLKELIAAWLDLTKDGSPLGGLDQEEAFQRAAELRPLLGSEKAWLPETLDEDSKDVLFALVALLEDSPAENLEARQEEGRAAFRFIAIRVWTPDEFGEKAELLSRCAELAGDSTDLSTLSALEVDSAANTSTVSGTELSFEDQADRIFGDSLPLLRMIARNKFGLKGQSATRLEQELYLWFQRFCRRPDSDRKGWQQSLFRACSKLAPRYQPINSAPKPQADGRSVPVQRVRPRDSGD